MPIHRSILFVFLFAVSLAAQRASVGYINQKNGYKNGTWGGREWLTAGSVPRLGGQFIVQVPLSHYDNSCSCVGTHILAVGARNPHVDLGVGFLYTTIDYATTMGIGTKGAVTYRRFRVPRASGLSGARFYVQVALFRTRGANGSLVQLSRAIEGVVGR